MLWNFTSMWRSQRLQTEISLSTLEAEYSALSHSMSNRKLVQGW